MASVIFPNLTDVSVDFRAVITFTRLAHEFNCNAVVSFYSLAYPYDIVPVNGEVIAYKGSLWLNITPVTTTLPVSGGVTLIDFIFTQSIASTTWVINHNLNRHPSVTIMDASNTIIFGDITNTSLNQIILNFSIPVSGSAYLV